MKLEDCVIEIPEIAGHLVDEFRYLYLYLYGLDKKVAKKEHGLFFVDNVGEDDEYNIVYSIDTIPEDKFPLITAFRKSEFGQLLGTAAFFTETDTRVDQERLLNHLDMHRHVESKQILNFPISHCTEDTKIGFHTLNTEERARTHLCDLGGVYLTDDRWNNDPTVEYSSKDGIPFILNADEWHSVYNNANVKRICAGWYFKRDLIEWSDLLELIRQQ